MHIILGMSVSKGFCQYENMIGIQDFSKLAKEKI